MIKRHITKRLFTQFSLPTLMTLVGVILMMGLGTWQLHRLSWKNALQIEVDNKKHLPAMQDESFLKLPLTQMKNAEYQRLQVTGTFLHDQEMKFMGRVYRGHSGYHIVTPLKTTSGVVIIVDRGWVPFNNIHGVERPTTLQTITGYMQFHIFQNAFTPHNNWESRELYTLDPTAIAEHYHLTALAPFILKESTIITTTTSTIQHYPIAIGLNFTLYNQHLQYAITWYMLAVILLTFYILFIRKKFYSKSF